MLFTCCPDCRTTYRVTAPVLRKASGQVRCGRCGSTFDAFSELREELPQPPDTLTTRPDPADDALSRTDEFPAYGPHSDHSPPSARAPSDDDTSEPPQPASGEHGRAQTADPTRADAGGAPFRHVGEDVTAFDRQDEASVGEEYGGEEYLGEEFLADENAESTEDAAASADDVLVADAGAPPVDDAAAVPPREQAGRDSGPDDAAADPREVSVAPPSRPAAESSDGRAGAVGTKAGTGTEEAASMTPEEVEAVLLPATEAQRTETASWHFEIDLPVTTESDRARRGWLAAALVAAALLAAQAVHHFRADIATQAGVGPWLRAAYGQLGVELMPRWDLEQYQIMNWVAAAEPNAGGGQGSLSITARIHNVGPTAQPYPHVKLELKDRWEAVVGSRIFRPEEYLPVGQEPNELLVSDETIEATLEVVDPGPDAYGFELDVCIQADVETLQCANDIVFR